MRRAFAVVRRDLKRMLKVPAAWIILFGLVFIPPLYAWFNIAGFWNPYGNTNGINVTVANNDRGTSSPLTGSMNLGKQITSQLKANHQLGWNFADEDEALCRVESSESYAAIIIPKDFSSRMAGVVAGKENRPKLEYYVNEKANALAPRMTDTGASTVETQVNETFVSTVSKVVSDTLNNANSSISQASNTATAQTIDDLTHVRSTVTALHNDIADLKTHLDAVPSNTTKARGSLAKLSRQGAQAGKDLKQTSTTITDSQQALNDFSAHAGSTLDESANLLSNATQKGNMAVNSVAGGLNVANSTVSSSLASAKTIVANNTQLISQLESLNLPNGSTLVSTLRQQNAQLNDSINALTKLNTDSGTALTDTQNTANSITTAAQTTLDQTSKARRALMSGALPKLSTGLNSLASSASQVGSGLESQRSLISQSTLVLDELDRAVANAESALDGTSSGLDTIYNQLGTLITDIQAISASSTLEGSGLLGKVTGSNGELDTAKVASLMLSPTVLDTKVVYPVKTYGSGMAPLFTNLTLWVGAFMLVVLLKLEVDDDEIEGLTSAERYYGRWMLLALIGVMQAVVTVLGELIIGVQCQSAPIFILTAVLASLVYVSITYALSTTFMHVGKALCVGLLIVQIPGTSGLYPIDMVPGFFHAMYPFFPFTYSINALRETIGGFYRYDWGINMGKLLLFGVLFFVAGMALKPLMGNVAQLVDRELKASDIIVSETPLHKPNEYPLSQAVRALADNEEYRESITEQAKRFVRLYPKLIHGGLAVGLVIPAVLALVFSLTTSTKVFVLVAWIVWFLLVIIFLLTVEVMRDSLMRQVRLGSLDERDVREMINDYHKSKRRRPHGKTTERAVPQTQEGDAQ